MSKPFDQDAQTKGDAGSQRASRAGCQKAPAPNTKTLEAMEELEAGKGQQLSSEQELFYDLGLRH